MGTRHLLRRRPVRVAIAAFLLVDAAVLGADVFLLANRSTTTTVDLQDALMTFRSAGQGDPAVTPTAAAGPDPTVPTPSVVAPVVPATGASAGMVASPSSTAAPTPTSSPTAGAAGATMPPAEGVYAYRTTGGESVSVLSSRHDYPATTYASVRQTGGCGWTMRSDVVKEHMDERRSCSGSGRVEQLSQEREITFFGSTDGSLFTCDPPQAQVAPGDGAGSKAENDCVDGKGSSVHLVRTTLGRSTIDVGGVAVEVVRIRIDGTLTGNVDGHSVDLLTFVAATGLPVTWERSVDTLATAFGSRVRYQEQARFDLVSLTPTT